MCGIFGSIRKLSTTGAYASSNDTFRDFLLRAMTASQIRGSDSTGVVKINAPYKTTRVGYGPNKDLPQEDRGRVWMLKLPIPASEFAVEPRVKHMFASIHDYTLGLIGHTRNASQASPFNNRNNHPHKVGSIIGVHNGNIANWRQLANKFNLKLKSRCDSEVIFALIEKFIYKDAKDLKDAIKEASFHLEGSYACVVFDTNDLKQFGFFRNNAPLFFRYRTTSSTLYFASTHDILSKAYGESKVDGATASKYYLDSGEVFLPNGYGYVLDQDQGFTDDWVKKAKPFELK